MSIQSLKRWKQIEQMEMMSLREIQVVGPNVVEKQFRLRVRVRGSNNERTE